MTRWFASGLALGFCLVFAMLPISYLTARLIWPSHIPAPAISNYAAIDEKLRFIRERPDIDPHILAVGSSIAWRQITGPAFAKIAGGDTRFLNGGVVHLQVHQTHATSRFYLDHFDAVQAVVLATSLNDFQDCTAEPEYLMNEEQAADYAFKRYPELLFYVLNFSPQRYLRSGLTLPERKTPFYGDLYIDRYGAGPVILTDGVDLGLRYGDRSVDPACVTALGAFARDMRARGVALVVAFAPVHPDYWTKFPESLSKTRQIIRGVEREAGGDGTLIVDMHDDGRFGAKDFYDAFHLMAPGADRLSALIASRLEEWKISSFPSQKESPVSSEHDTNRTRDSAPRSSPAG
jgi:hypothetical protein